MAEGDRWIELEEGVEFAGYRIERRLGRGGMGILYLAVEPGLDRRVALKLIAPEAAADEVFRRRFAEETKIAASIEHPNVVPIYAAGEEGGVPYIAMRFVAGSDLARRVAAEGRLEPAHAVALIAQVGNGLDAIHAAGLVHRDVKPANVLLSGGEGDPHAYITDFGVARNVATESGITQTGRFVGTLDYIAPEQISGAEVDARADVYALGCLLYKLLTGDVPFPKEGEAARLYAHLNDPPPAPSLFASRVPMALDDVVIRAMSKPPEDRYPSAGDLGRAALAAMRGESVTVPERTVATGAAATRTAETISPVGAREGVPEKPSTSATRRLPPDPQSKRPGRRRVAMGGAFVAVLVAVIAVVIIPGGGGGEQGGGSATTAVATARSDPKPLSKNELIGRGDAICADSQETYRRIFSQTSEQSPDAVYSQALVGISTRAVGRFRKLEPPPGLEEDYDAYVAAQERVKRYDQEAWDAAKAGDAEAYLVARAKRDDEQAQRFNLARAIGFETCSLSPE